MEISCIVCPNSCLLNVIKTGEGYAVSGNQCRRGFDFAIAESTNPTRMFTSTVCIQDGEVHRLPVISSREIPKGKLPECQKLLSGIRVTAPVKCGDIIIDNICGTGIDVMASRTVKKLIM